MAIKKLARTVERGKVFISATFTNTIVTITDADGNTV